MSSLSNLPLALLMGEGLPSIDIDFEGDRGLFILGISFGN